MNKFKKGDWVVPSGIPFNRFEGTKQVEKIKKETYLIDSSWCVENDFKLWQPQPSEWCWFWSQGFVPHISRFKEMYGDGEFINYYEDKEVITFSSHCEPFIGKLPTFVKDQHDS